MTIQQLRYAVALDTHRHFISAAKSCFVSQPTLTLQLKKLEDEIGLPLFDRSVKPLRPTPVGKGFIAKARNIIADIDRLKESVNSERNQVKGNYVIGVIPTLAPYLLPLFLTSFLAKNSSVHLEVKELQTHEILEGLAQNTVDIGIAVTPIDEPHVREIPMFYEPFLVYANKNHAFLDKNEIQVNDLERDDLWLLSQGHCFREQVLNLCQQNYPSPADRFSFESGSIETLKNIITSTSGFTLIPELSIKKSDAPFVKRVTIPQPSREVSLLVHSSFSKEQLLENLRKSVVENVPKHFSTNDRFFIVDWK